jgi:hypothetical protein
MHFGSDSANAKQIAVPAIPVLQHGLDHSLGSFAFFLTSVVQSVQCGNLDEFSRTNPSLLYYLCLGLP